MIHSKLIRDNAPSNMGEQVHINHTGCPAGEDHKRRLYIKRTERGLVAYCHHCNDKGFATDAGSRLSSWVKPAATKAFSEPTALPTLTKSLSIGGQIWLNKYYCDASDDRFHGVVGEDGRVCLSLTNLSSEIVGYQYRNLHGKEPKYVSQFFSQDDRGSASWFPKPTGNQGLVITEDYLSAYRVHRDTDYSAVALLRTSLTDKTLMQIVDLPPQPVFIWLDSDDAGIGGAKKVLQKLRHFLPTGTDISVISSTLEPKQCTPAELKARLP
jgi:hypothetical protein